MDKENLPVDLYEEFDFEDFCKGCQYLEFETEFTKATCITGKITINLKHSCLYIDKCRRLKYTLDK